MVTDLSPARADTLEGLIRSRRSVRYFRDEAVPREVVEDLLREVLWAPSPHNAQPWRFTVLCQKDDRERLAVAMAARLAEELQEAGIEETEIARQTDRSRERITGAPVVILCSLVTDGLVHYGDVRRDALEWQMAVQSVGAALQTLFLLAHARGIGSCWMAAPMYCPEVVRAAARLPGELAPQALVLLGYAAGEGRVRPRRPFHEVVELR